MRISREGREGVSPCGEAALPYLARDCHKLLGIPKRLRRNATSSQSSRETNRPTVQTQQIARRPARGKAQRGKSDGRPTLGAWALQAWPWLSLSSGWPESRDRSQNSPALPFCVRGCPGEGRTRPGRHPGHTPTFRTARSCGPPRIDGHGRFRLGRKHRPWAVVEGVVRTAPPHPSRERITYMVTNGQLYT